MKVICPKCNHEFISKGNTTKILDLIKGGDKKISDFSKILNISRPAVYHHLNKLLEQGLIIDYFLKEKGKPHYFKIKQDTPQKEGGIAMMKDGTKTKQGYAHANL